jgi:hypothetical protein
VEHYEHGVAAFEPLFQKRATQSSIGFAADIDVSKKTVISLLPGESNADEGLFYRLYKNRYAEVTGLSLAQVQGLLPQRHDDWAFDVGADWEGFEGFITSPEEVDRLASGLLQAPAQTTP